MKTRVILSLDYDGCTSIIAEGGVKAELEGQNKEEYEKPKYDTFKARLLQTPQQYKQYLDQITAGADAVSVYVGSDRQSYTLDKWNADRNKNGSVFPALEALCQTRTTVGCPWTFEPYLLADTGFERGEALRRIKSETPPHLEAPESNGSKIPLLLAQMSDAYRQYHGETLEFHFVDDRQDLIDDICENLDPHLIPPGMTLKISKFDYFGIANQDPGSLCQVAEILSSQAPQIVQPIVSSRLDLEGDAGGHMLSGKTMMTSLTDKVSEYLQHFKDKFKLQEIECSGGALSIRSDYSSEKVALVTRYNTILALEQLITGKDALDGPDIVASQACVRTCWENKPDRDENRKFLSGLIDVLKMHRPQLIDLFFTATPPEKGHQKEGGAAMRPRERD